MSAPSFDNGAVVVGGGQCPFCELPADDLVWSSELVVAIRDRYPVTRGHTLVVTRRHVRTYFDAGAIDQAELWRAVDDLKDKLDDELQPTGYNVGFNVGAAAGQTIDHLHIHVIPRYDGDVDDPRGGVRGVIPNKQNYLSPPAAADGDEPPSERAPSEDGVFARLPRFVPGEEHPFRGAITEALQLADEADLVVAFIQPSGLDLIQDHVEDALKRGAHIRVLTGDYHNITSADALRTLLHLSQHPGLQARFFQVARSGLESFHAKAYLFRAGPEAIAYVGSSNLSRTALTSGIEWNLRLVSSQDTATLDQIAQRFTRLWNDSRTQPLSRAVIDSYEARAPVPATPEPRTSAPEPHAIQRLALVALKATRGA